MIRNVLNVLYAMAGGFALVFMVMDLPAIAQVAVNAVPATGGVDFGPLAQNVIASAVMILTITAGIVGKYVVSFFASKVHMQDSAAEKLAADRVNDVLYRAIDYAEAWAKTQVADQNSQIHHVKIDNFFLAKAVEFSIASMPDLIKLFGLTRERLEAMLLSRLNAIMPVPPVNSGSPATFSEVTKTDPVKAALTAETVKDSAKAVADTKAKLGEPEGKV